LPPAQPGEEGESKDTLETHFRVVKNVSNEETGPGRTMTSVKGGLALKITTVLTGGVQPGNGCEQL